MSLLPTAHAGQSFGARRIDFYTVSGEVSVSDDGTGRVTDTDGMSHDVRLLERSNALAPGDTASVLRVQAGPNRRSRPAAIINHSRGTWMRAAPDATGLLSRSGVTRGFNWWLSVLALALVGIAAVWPAVHGFLTEVNGGLMASVPAFDVFAEMNALMPALAGWRLEAALPTGLLDTIASLGFVPMGQLTEWGLAGAASLLALLAFLGRSWRLVYIPALALLALATGTILASALATLAVVGGSLVLFMLGGLVNRIRDGGRFNARVARLAEHALRNPPHEGVRQSNDAAVAGVTASAAIAAATAAAHGENGLDAENAVAATAETDAAGDSGDAGDFGDTSDAGGALETAATEAETSDGEIDHASGEAEAPSQDDLLPAAPTAAEDERAELAETAAAATLEDSGETEAAADTAPNEGVTDQAANDDGTAPGNAAGEDDAIKAAARAPGEGDDTVASSEIANDQQDAPAEPAMGATQDVGAPETAASAAEREEETAEAAVADAGDVADARDPAAAVELDDDLPSLDDVAAAAALTAAETGESETTAGAEPAPRSAVDLDDERTMPVAPPPPMPGNDAPDPVTETTAEQGPEGVDPGAADNGGDGGGTTDPSAALQAVETPGETPADTPADTPVGITAMTAEDSAPIVDDPMMDMGDDPMMSSEGQSDYAPGAPEVDLDRTPA
ncbi:hypothetical protein [Maricaulis sp.]|uniref:hypothetical protein n=1 Tax=Maricaulis sp. TaxID=1486257 RepID=UPI0025BADE0C|nr:hypothetical protein [Maricaulis sp.]